MLHVYNNCCTIFRVYYLNVLHCYIIQFSPRRIICYDQRTWLCVYLSSDCCTKAGFQPHIQQCNNANSEQQVALHVHFHYGILRSNCFIRIFCNCFIRIFCSRQISITGRDHLRRWPVFTNLKYPCWRNSRGVVGGSRM